MNYREIVTKWKDFQLPEVKLRMIELDLSLDFILAIIGPRRAGKTYVCYRTIHELIKSGVAQQNIFYVNFEDEKMLGATVTDLEQIYQTFLEIFAPVKDQRIFLFLDEIQNIAQWEMWVRRMFDTEKRIKLIITGSSSKLLSGEFSTRLGGRVINIEVLPLGLKEILNWKEVTFNLKTLPFDRSTPDIKRIYNEYLQYGGYPQVVSLSEPAKNYEVICQTYYNAMILKDIIERHQIKEVKKIRILGNLLFQSIAREFSYTKLTNLIASYGDSVGKQTVIDYISYFTEAYVFFEHLKFDYALAQQISANKKIFCIDNALIYSMTFRMQDESARLLENIVFLELKRRHMNCFFYKRKHECDFIIHEKESITAAIQVTWLITEQDAEREYNGLLEALKEYHLEKGLVLTYDTFEEKGKLMEGKIIEVKPVWWWLLQNTI